MLNVKIINEIGVLELNNPPENYLREPVFADINELRETIDKNQLKGIIITGAGRHYSAGADLENLFKMARESNFSDMIDTGKGILDFINDLDIPVISAVRGICFGGGLEIALSAHIRVGSERTLFAFPEANHNMMPGLGGTVRLPKIVGRSSAMEIILTGDTIDGEKAYEIGLLDHITETKEIFNYSMALMERMVKNRSLKIIKNITSSINFALKNGEKEAMLNETKLFCELALDEAKNR